MAAAVTRQIGGATWQVDAEFAAALFPDQGETLASLVAAGRAEPVKGGHERRTGRATFGGHTYYIKEFAGALAGRRARREWERARTAFEAGLVTPRPVAATWQGRAVCVTLDAGPGQTLSDLVYEAYFESAGDEPPYPGHRPPELVRLYRRRRPRPAGDATGLAANDAPSPREVARLVADLVVALHSLGLRHRDMHPGNLLVRRAAGTEKGNGGPPPMAAGTAANGEQPGDHQGRPCDGERQTAAGGAAWELVVMDLAALGPVGSSAEAGPRAVVDHLVQLNHFFEPLTTRAERLRVLKMLESRGLRPAATAAEIEAATWAYRYRFYRGRDRRALRDGKYFARIAAGRMTGMAAAEAAQELARSASALARVAQITETVKPSSREVSGFGRLGERRVFIKRDTQRGWRGSGRPWPAVVEHVLRGSRQERAWRRANALLVRGLRTARPLVWLDVSHGLLGRESLIVSEALESPWQPLDRAVPAATGPAHLRLVETVAREVRRMHDAGISNRDLKAQNILVQCRDGRWQVALVDMAGVVVRARQASREERGQNLMRLAFSWSGIGVSGQARGLTRADRLRFLKTYLGPYARQTITTACRDGQADEVIEAVRTWWRGLAFALYEKAENARR